MNSNKHFLSILLLISGAWRVLGSTSPTAAPSSARSSSINIKIYAGTGTAASSGTGGSPLAASLNNPRSIWADSAGVYYILEGGFTCVRKIDTSNIVQAYAGMCGSSGYSGDGGAATSATFNFVVAIFGSSSGTMYLPDYGKYVIRSVSSSGVINTICGGTSFSNTGNGGPASSAGFLAPHGVWVNSLGVVYVTSYQGYVVRKIDTSNIITTFAGKLLF